MQYADEGVPLVVLAGTLEGNVLALPGGARLFVPPAPELPPGARAAYALPARS